MGQRRPQLPTAAQCRAWRDRFAALGDAVPAAEVVPDPIPAEEGADGLQQRALCAVEAQSVECASLDDSGAIDETGGGAKAGFD